MAIGVTTLESRFVIPGGKAVRNLRSPAESMVQARSRFLASERQRLASWQGIALAIPQCCRVSKARAAT